MNEVRLPTQMKIKKEFGQMKLHKRGRKFSKSVYRDVKIKGLFIKQIGYNTTEMFLENVVFEIQTRKNTISNKQTILPWADNWGLINLNYRVLILDQNLGTSAKVKTSLNLLGFLF